MPSAAHLRARVDGIQRDCLLDSGADVSIIPTQWVTPRKLQPAERQLTAANGTQIVVDGEARLSVIFGDIRTEAVFLASPNIDEVILGRDWLCNNDIIWKFKENMIKVNGYFQPLEVKPHRVSRCSRCVTQSDVTIPPRSEAVIPAYFVYSRLGDVTPGENWSTVLSEPTSGLRIAHTLVDSSSARIHVRACNITDRPVKLYRGQTVSQLHAVDALEAFHDTSHAKHDENRSAAAIAEIIQKIDPSLPPESATELRILLESYSDVLSTDEFDLGCTNIVQHRIDTGSHKPSRQSLRPQARAHLPVIDKMLTEMQEQGVIEPCQSEWASNIVLVKKKDGSIRFCVDYRKVNNLTTKDAYPLPRIDTCLDTLAGAVWYSTFDLRSGFHQVAMDSQDINKTTFVCHRGTFRFPRMPFGLCNAPATFQRLMDTVMAGLNFETCLVYLDDINVFSHDLASHFQRIRLLLDRLRAANLKLKPSKCHMMQKKVSFLGFTVSHDGVGTDPDKTSAIENWPTPTTVRQSRAFVGLCQYYRRFVPNFSDIAAPLHALTKKGARFEWTPQCSASFQQLKSALVSADVLALPTVDGRFVLDCDASDFGIGAGLSQIQNDEERPICYASQLYNRHERNYNVTRKELLALITFVKKFKQYLLGRPFIIRTDHAALQWLKRTPEPIGQQARWLEILEEFDYEVQHRAGTKHCNADALSRRPATQNGTVSATRNIVDSHQSVSHHQQPFPPALAVPDGFFDWRKLQQEDPDVQFVYDIVQNESPRPTPESTTARNSDVKKLCSELERFFIGSDGVLRRRWIHLRKEHQQIVVPYGIRSEIAADMHKGLNGGHFGTRRARLQLQRRFFWPGWSKSVKIAQLQCPQCARHKRLQNSRQGQLQPMVVGEPWERLGIDVTGPHPTSSKGNVYILTMIDHFTKWIEIFPMKNQEASTIAQILVNQVFCVYGLPQQILTDRGQNFESELFKEICVHLSIDKIRTTAYKPSTNGNIERFHGTLNSLLAKWVATNHRNWDDHLPAVAFAYRTSVQETTGFTPFSLMFGREARIPADMVYGTPEDPTLFNSPVEFVASQQEKLRDAFELVRNHLGTSAIRRKTTYDLRTRPHVYNVGDWAWLLNPRHSMKRGHKWTSPYDGPFLVTKQLGPVNVQIQRSQRSGTSVVHIDKLKPCHTPGLSSWLECRNEQTGPAAETDQADITASHYAPCPSTDESESCNTPSKRSVTRPKRTVRKPARFL